MEFFVANTLACARKNSLPLTVINNALNPEILSFITDSGRMPAFLDYVLELMQRFAGELDLAILRKIRDHVDEHNLDTSSGQASIDLILAYLFIYEEVLDESRVSRIITRFNADVSR